MTMPNHGNQRTPASRKNPEDRINRINRMKDGGWAAGRNSDRMNRTDRNSEDRMAG
jgi:hypothetical protein